MSGSAPRGAAKSGGGSAAAGAATATAGHGRTPTEFLKHVLGRAVVVKLNNATEYRGVLACLDGYMNIALEQTEEYRNGELQSKDGDAFIRGNNVLYISTVESAGHGNA